MNHEERTFKSLTSGDGLFRLQVCQGGTDLLISCDKDISYIAEKELKQTRIDLTKYLAKEPKFETSHIPVKVPYNAPKLIKTIASAAFRAKVGPMAAFQGAVAEAAGREMLKRSSEVIVENGGDIFIKSSHPRLVTVFAEASKFSEKTALEIDPSRAALGICISSAAARHTFDQGAADAVVVLSGSCALSGSAAASIASLVKKNTDIDAAIERSKKIKGLSGVLIIKGDTLSLWGRMKIIQVSSKQ